MLPSLPRPHTTTSAAKAMANAIALDAAITAHPGHFDQALAVWEPRQLALGRASKLTDKCSATARNSSNPTHESDPYPRSPELLNPSCQEKWMQRGENRLNLRRIAFSVNSRNQRSTRLVQEALVGARATRTPGPSHVRFVASSAPWGESWVGWARGMDSSDFIRQRCSGASAAGESPLKPLTETRPF